MADEQRDLFGEIIPPAPAAAPSAAKEAPAAAVPQNGGTPSGGAVSEAASAAAAKAPVQNAVQNAVQPPAEKPTAPAAVAPAKVFGGFGRMPGKPQATSVVRAAAPPAYRPPVKPAPAASSGFDALSALRGSSIDRQDQQTSRPDPRSYAPVRNIPSDPFGGRGVPPPSDSGWMAILDWACGGGIAPTHEDMAIAMKVWSKSDAVPGSVMQASAETETAEAEASAGIQWRR